MEGLVMDWQTAERVQKNDAGQFRALIGGQWAPAERAQKSESGQYRVMLPSAAALTGPSAIPTEPGANLAPTVAPEQTFGEKLMGYVEAPLAVGASVLGGLPTYLAGAGGPAFQRKVAEQIQYQPRTPQAQAAVEAVGRGAEALKIPPYLSGGFGALAPTMLPAARTVADVGRAEGSLIKGAITAPLEARAARLQEANVAKSYANAPMIDATQSAQRIGGVVPPAISNPTTSNVIKGKLAGPEVEQQFAKINEAAVTNKVRENLGVKPTEKLIPEIDEVTGKINNNSPVTRALDKESEAYAPIRKMESLAVPDESIAALEALRKEATIGGGPRTEAINALIDDALAKLQKTTTGAFSGVGGGPVSVGRSGNMILEDIRSARRDAQATRRAQKINPDPLALAKADTQTAIANILEDVIDANAPSPKVLGDLRAARTRIAQIYDHENAFDYGPQKVDPQAYAKMYQERQGAMTGLGADIAKAAATFPDYFTLTPAQLKGLPRVSRGGIGAAIGAAAGSTLGPVGALVGMSGGMAAGSLGGSLAARRMATPAYQAAHAVPTDYRPPVNMLRPVEPNLTPNGLVPYDYAQQTTVPPNFVMQPNQYGPRVTPVAPEVPPTANMLGYGGTMETLASEKARAANMSRTLGQQAEAQQAAAEAAARRPTSGAVELQINPLTGVPEIAKGVKGATPEVFMANTGASLSSAASKLAAGKAFDMTMAEKAAWKATRTDLSEIMPGFKALDEKSIAAKMMDRAWVDSAITKARQEAQAFDRIAERAADARARSSAVANRERMLDLAEQLQDALGARPVQRGGQGPKTRAFQRNMLTPEQEIQNALAK